MDTVDSLHTVFCICTCMKQGRYHTYLAQKAAHVRRWTCHFKPRRFPKDNATLHNAIPKGGIFRENELPRVRFELTTFCILDIHVHVYTCVIVHVHVIM